jgi:glycosyltransferase involved in cell wall biosynthesis
MGMEKGVSTLINSLVLLPEDFILYVVGGLGGKEEDVDFYKKIAIEKKVDDRVIFTGKVPHSDIPMYISTCDVLASPFPDYEHYRYYMSPLKIFEYMASKKPIISTNLPSIKEVLIDQHNSILVSPDSPSELSNAIVKLTKDTSLSNKISENAYLDVSTKYTWNIRARNILEFINK